MGAVTLAQLRPVLRELGRAEAVAMTAMTGGNSPTFRLDLADGAQLVLKIYADEARWRDGREVFAAAQLEHLPVPITRYLLIDGSCGRLPCRFAVTNFLPGATLKALENHPDVESAYRQAGALLRQLHAVKMPAFGAFGADGIVNPVASNAEFMRRLIASAFERFLHFGGDARLAEALRKIVAAEFDSVVPQSSGAVFAHDDLHPNNLLALEQPDGTLKLSGLIDFGNAQAADAVFDLAKCLFCSQHEAPGSRAPMLEGYGGIDHPNPDAALRYYTLLHRMIMWWWLRHVGVIATPSTPSGLIDDLWGMVGG